MLTDTTEGIVLGMFVLIVAGISLAVVLGAKASSRKTPLVERDPGWYADPAGSGQQRRWDGRVWTDEYRPSQPTTR